MLWQKKLFENEVRQRNWLNEKNKFWPTLEKKNTLIKPELSRAVKYNISFGKEQKSEKPRNWKTEKQATSQVNKLSLNE